MDLSRISDTHSEAVVIATLVYHPEFIMHSDFLKPGYFYNIENGCIYWAISELYKSGIDKIDALNISTMLDSNKAVKRKMEEHNLTNMQEFIELCSPAARDTLEEYRLSVGNVVTMAFKRDMIKASNEVERLCMNDTLTLSEVNSKINEKMNSVAEKYLVTGEISTLGDKIDDIWEEIESEWNGTGIAGIPTMIPELNKYATHERSELMLVAGRMKTGKSAFMLNEALNMIKNGISVLYIDTEMSDKLFTLRAISSLTGIRVGDIKGGNLDQEQKTKVKQTMEWLKKQNLVHEYITQPNEDEIYAMCRILKHKIDLGFVVYDYIKSDNTDSVANYNLLGKMTNFLKNRIAGEIDVPVLAGAQLNRDDNIADSDKINRYVSTSLLWIPKTSDEMRDNGNDCGNFKLIVDKNRNGEQMLDGEWIDVMFDGNRMRIKQAPKQHKTPNPFN